MVFVMIVVSKNKGSEYCVVLVVSMVIWKGMGVMLSVIIN